MHALVAATVNWVTNPDPDAAPPLSELRRAAAVDLAHVVTPGDEGLCTLWSDRDADPPLPDLAAWVWAAVGEEPERELALDLTQPPYAGLAPAPRRWRTFFGVRLDSGPPGWIGVGCWARGRGADPPALMAAMWMLALGVLVRSRASAPERASPDYPAIIREGAHDMQNQVMVLAVGLDLLTGSSSPPNDQEDIRAKMRSAVDRLSVLLQRLRTARFPEDIRAGD